MRRHGEAGRCAASERASRYALTLVPVLDEIRREAGRTPATIAAELTRRGIRKPRGNSVWTPPDVRKLLRRLSSTEGA